MLLVSGLDIGKGRQQRVQWSERLPEGERWLTNGAAADRTDATHVWQPRVKKDEFNYRWSKTRQGWVKEQTKQTGKSKRKVGTIIVIRISILTSSFSPSDVILIFLFLRPHPPLSSYRRMMCCALTAAMIMTMIGARRRFF
eukprot:1232673-Rhodomonas_salina.3